MNRHAERTAATRAQLLAVARERFAVVGFDGVSGEELVASIGLSRGALYHHFGGKEGLFAALHDQLQAEMAERIVAAADAEPDAWSALVAGCLTFLDLCLDPVIQRLVLHDAPRVLGWDAWREADNRHGLAALRDGLTATMAAGYLPERPVEPLARLLTGAMNEAALWIAQADSAEQALAQSRAALAELLAGLR